MGTHATADNIAYITTPRSLLVIAATPTIGYSGRYQPLLLWLSTSWISLR